ncbi:MAG TPA: alpha/beta hydrolase [Edaphobacter sp.]
MTQARKFIWFFALCFCASHATNAQAPAPPGKLVDLGGHRLHMNCTGKGHPTVVVEAGLGDFSFDWALVQSRVSRFTRICTYDRAGYAWSDPGPMPRTFAQLNLELKDALEKVGERGPFVLVGHSFGGPVVRNFAALYPKDVVGMVLVDAAFEGQRVAIGGDKTIRLGESARGRPIPVPRETITNDDRPESTGESRERSLDPMYNPLPPAAQKMQVWAQSLAKTDYAEESQREWSEEYYAKWLRTPQDGALGNIPLVVLMRAEGGYVDDLDVPAVQLEKERKEGQVKLLQLSTKGKLVTVQSGHNMEIDAPEDVVAAIRSVVDSARAHGKM